MKPKTNSLFRLMAIILPMILLCSCYEIVYVSQEKDDYPNTILSPEVCVQVYMINDKPVKPYFGMLVPDNWEVKNYIPYTKKENNYSIKIGSIIYDKAQTKIMEKLDPSPLGYYWWVGIGDKNIPSNGVYRAFPLIQAGPESGHFSIDYMMGDTENGLNLLRSNNHDFNIAHATAAVDLTATAKEKSILLKWMPPQSEKNMMGYYIYRNGKLVNDMLVSEESWVDQSMDAGSYSYSVVPLYMDGSMGVKCTPAKICYTPCGNSMQFDGKDGRVIVFDNPTLNLTGTFTMEAWFNYSPGKFTQPRIISKGEKGSGYELFLSQLGKSKSLEFRLPMGKLKSVTPLAPNTWYHVAAVYTGMSMKMFINGEFDCERHVAGLMNNIEYPLVIGKASTSNTNYFNGSIDEVRIWNVRRTSAEIKDFFSSEVDNNDPSLIGSWRMSEGCSKMVCDASGSQNHAFLSGSCWNPAKFPYIEKTHNQTNSKLMTPVINYLDLNHLPDVIQLEFKINPKLLKFEGIVTENTLLASYGLKVHYKADGRISIKANKKVDVFKQSKVLAYVDLKALQPHVKTQLQFISCIADGYPFRVGSGEIIATALPTKYKTEASGTSAINNLLNLFPNPASSNVHVHFGELAEPAELSILSITGQELYRQTFEINDSNTIQTINLSGFSKGIYVVNLRVGGSNTIQKLAIN